MFVIYLQPASSAAALPFTEFRFLKNIAEKNVSPFPPTITDQCELIVHDQSDSRAINLFTWLLIAIQGSGFLDRDTPFEISRLRRYLYIHLHILSAVQGHSEGDFLKVFGTREEGAGHDQTRSCRWSTFSREP